MGASVLVRSVMPNAAPTARTRTALLQRLNAIKVGRVFINLLENNFFQWIEVSVSVRNVMRNAAPTAKTRTALWPPLNAMKVGAMTASDRTLAVLKTTYYQHIFTVFSPYSRFSFWLLLIKVGGLSHKQCRRQRNINNYFLYCADR